ncbi:MAG TPA: hypothetical protein PK080_10050 [Hyphomonadaceae bacterium]|jgi:hypothetical protein|nr:hypothetical protein [Hyphomonadaceae bacterium]
MLARLGRIALVAVVFALIASAVITAQFLLDGLPLDASFLWACAFFSCALVAIAVGYGLGDELRRAWAAGGIGRAWPWLTIIAICAGLFWSLSVWIDASAGMSVGPFPPMLLVLGVPLGAIGFRRNRKP